MSNFSAEEDFLSSLLPYSAVLLVGHENPDADCIASQLVLEQLFLHLNKDVHLLNAGPFTAPELWPYQDRFTVKPAPLQGTAIVVFVDCPGIFRSGASANFLHDFPFSVIDHHLPHPVKGRSPESLLIDPHQPAVAVLVFRLMKAASVPLSKECAELLFLALASDSGFFRFLDEGQAEALHMASELVAAGVSPREMHAALTSGRQLQDIKMLSLIIGRATSFHNAQVLLCWVTHEEDPHAKLQSSLLFEILMPIETLCYVLLLRELSPELCKGSLRSKRFDVSRIAQKFGGGGHSQAAGFVFRGSLNDAKKTLIEVINQTHISL